MEPMTSSRTLKTKCFGWSFLGFFGYLWVFFRPIKCHCAPMCEVVKVKFLVNVQGTYGKSAQACTALIIKEKCILWSFYGCFYYFMTLRIPGYACVRVVIVKISHFIHFRGSLAIFDHYKAFLPFLAIFGHFSGLKSVAEHQCMKLLS